MGVGRRQYIAQPRAFRSTPGLAVEIYGQTTGLNTSSTDFSRIRIFIVTGQSIIHVLVHLEAFS